MVEGAKAANEIRKNGWKATAVTVDVSVEESVKNLVEQTVETYGEVDVLVNNAGVYPLIPLREMSLADFDEVIAINLKGTFLCTKYVSERMVKRQKGGKKSSTSLPSTRCIRPRWGSPTTTLRSTGCGGSRKNIALELAPHKIWVNAVAPGGIMTPGVQKLQRSTPTPEGMGVGGEVLKGSLSNGIPMERLGVPDDIGKVVVFLASDMASYMTGSQIVVDGGLLLM